MDEAYQAYRSAVESPTLRSIWTDVYCERMWEGGDPPTTVATIDDVRFVARSLDPRQASRLVDLGCGSGPLSRHLAGVFGAHVVGVDANPVAVRLAEERSRNNRFQAILSSRHGTLLRRAVQTQRSMAR